MKWFCQTIATPDVPPAITATVAWQVRFAKTLLLGDVKVITTAMIVQFEEIQFPTV